MLEYSLTRVALFAQATIRCRPLLSHILAGTFILFLDGCKNHESQKLRISWHFLCSQYRPAYVPSLFFSNIKSKYFQSFFLDNFIFLLLDIVKIFLWHMFLPCFFSMRFKMLSKYFQSFFRQFHFLISRYCKNIPLAYVPSLLFSMLTGPISPLRCCLQRIFC